MKVSFDCTPAEYSRKLKMPSRVIVAKCALYLEAGSLLRLKISVPLL